MVSGLGGKGKAPNPSSGSAGVASARRCPILVRAALIVTCPPLNKSTNAPQLTHEDPTTKKLTCPAASSIQVHLRAEQVFKITGQPTIQTVDTIVDRKTAASISIDQLLKQKYPGQCLPGMTMTSSGCRY